MPDVKAAGLPLSSFSTRTIKSAEWETITQIPPLQMLQAAVLPLTVNCRLENNIPVKHSSSKFMKQAITTLHAVCLTHKRATSLSSAFSLSLTSFSSHFPLNAGTAWLGLNFNFSSFHKSQRNSSKQFCTGRGCHVMWHMEVSFHLWNCRERPVEPGL